MNTKAIVQIMTANVYIEQECDVCYKPIGKKFAQCSAPCNKIFHTSCMEQMMDQTEETAYEASEEALHRCCYCRRQIDMNRYSLEVFAHRLLSLRASGYYDVLHALKQVQNHIIYGESDEDTVYEIFELNTTPYIKKPKQSKRSHYLKKPRPQPRIHIKQNIGGRRR